MNAFATWPRLQADYIECLRTRHFADRTTAILSRWIARFADFCHTHGVDNPAGVSTDQVDAFHHHLLWQRGKTALYLPTTVDQALRAVRGFFRWAVRQNRLFADPTRHLVLRRPPRSQPPVLTVAEVERVLDAPSPATRAGLRDRAVLETLYSTGVRRGECTGLDVDDVDFDNQVLRIRHGKSRVQRLVPLGDHLAGVLRRYLSDCRPRLASHPGEVALFLSNVGTRYGDESLGQMVRKWARQAGVGPLTPHGMRHLFATHMLEAGADVTDIQQLLGHVYLQSTSIYTAVHLKDLARFHRRNHPRAPEQ